MPRFEARFKELLNENTIREVANFQSQLARQGEEIRDRIERINHSLAEIDYNRGRYIVLEAQPAPDADVRDFRSELRACTEGALTGSDDAEYSEAKFVEVKRIIDRLRGREGLPEQDRRWTAKVTDVRNWFVFLRQRTLARRQYGVRALFRFWRQVRGPEREARLYRAGGQPRLSVRAGAGSRTFSLLPFRRD